MAARKPGYRLTDEDWAEATEAVNEALFGTTGEPEWCDRSGHIVGRNGDCSVCGQAADEMQTAKLPPPNRGIAVDRAGNYHVIENAEPATEDDDGDDAP